MIFGIICVVLLAGVAYFHWVQGLFSGAISMALAGVAATLAVGLNEWITVDLLGSPMGDLSSGVVMLLTFAAIYGIARIIFDMFIPGNVRVPLYVDKVGGLLCGLVAGAFGVGTFAIAAQTMPVGPTIFGFSRYELDEERQTTMYSNSVGRSIDAVVDGTVRIDKESAAFPPPEGEKSPMLGLDSTVASFVGYQSGGGAFAGSVPFDRVHPDLLKELFFSRLGIEMAPKNVAKKGDFTLVGLWSPPSLVQADGEPLSVRRRELAPRLNSDPKAGTALLIVRVQPNRNATEKDGKLRFSTGSVRLVSGGVDYYPIGTMHYPGDVLLAARADDYLIGNGKPFDVVFEVPVGAGKVFAENNGEAKIASDAFIEIKRFGRVDLSGKPVTLASPRGNENGIERKQTLLTEVAARISSGGKLPPPAGFGPPPG